MGAGSGLMADGCRADAVAPTGSSHYVAELGNPLNALRSEADRRTKGRRRVTAHPKPAARTRTGSSAARPAVAEAGAIERTCVTAVLARAAESGLTSGKGGRISGRVSPALIERAKARTGLQSDTELIAFALANVAIEDDFVPVFRSLRGTVDPELDLNF